MTINELFRKLAVEVGSEPCYTTSREWRGTVYDFHWPATRSTRRVSVLSELRGGQYIATVLSDDAVAA